MKGANKYRQEFWHYIHLHFSPEELTSAQARLTSTDKAVCELCHTENKTFKEISVILNRSLTVVRNKHNRGIYLLSKYFTKHYPECRELQVISQRISQGYPSKIQKTLPADKADDIQPGTVDLEALLRSVDPFR